MIALTLLAAAAAAAPAPARAEARASIVITAPRQEEWARGEAAERYRLRELPPPPASGPRPLVPLIRLTF